jgi:methyltransferase-like protein 6
LFVVHPVQAIANIAATLRLNTGRILFRDYAEGDLAQHRLQDKGVKMISPHFYVRGDGTCCYYFSQVYAH